MSIKMFIMSIEIGNENEARFFEESSFEMSYI